MRWKKSIAVMLGVALLLCMRIGHAQDAGPENRPESADALHILVLGDSLSAEYGLPRGSGWVQHIAQQLDKRNQAYQIRNASISGDTTIGGLKRLPALLQQFRADLVVLQLGANDGLRGQPVETMKENLRKMIALSRNAGASVLLVGQHLPPNYGRRYAEQFHQAYAEVATETGVARVPFMLEGIATDPGMFQADGLHPTTAAQAIIAETMWPYLEPLLH